MADLARRLTTNVAGPLYVDRTCIDCDTCRQLAPATFADAGGRSSVRVQPVDAAATAAALRALVACPVGAIGDEAHRPLRDAVTAFPLEIEPGVSDLGFRSRDSYGGASYLLERPDGNWMIDAPRWNATLARAIAERGGLRTIFLTHRDDVADAARYAERFGATRIIHGAEAAAMPDAERFLDGEEPVAIGDVLLIPTPGHTRGHTVALWNGILFAGDHLAWDAGAHALSAHPSVCWYDFRTQLRSVAKLAAYPIRRILPGHGDPIAGDPVWMRAQIEAAARGPA